MSENKNVTPAKSQRHRSRELAMQGVYEWRLSGGGAAQIEKTTRVAKGLARHDEEL